MEWRKGEALLEPFFSARAPLCLLVGFGFLFSGEIGAHSALFGFSSGRASLCQGRARRRPGGGSPLLSSTRLAGPSVLSGSARSRGSQVAEGGRNMRKKTWGVRNLRLGQRPVFSPGARVPNLRVGGVGSGGSQSGWFHLCSGWAKHPYFEIPVATPGAGGEVGF